MLDLAPLIDRFHQLGVTVETVDGGGWDSSSANGTAFAQMGGVMAEWYSRVIGEKVTRAHADRANSGKAHGGPRPFGFRHPAPGEPDSPSLVVEPAEAQIVREMATRYLAGESLSAIAQDLNARGVDTAADGRWYPTQVIRTIEHPRMAGLHSYRDEIVGDGDWSAVLDRDVWERVQARTG